MYKVRYCVRWAVLFIPLALIGCAAQQAARDARIAERQAARDVTDNTRCLSLGVPKGSQPYVACRLQIAHDRSVSSAIAHAQDQQMYQQMFVTGVGMMSGY